MMEAQEILDIVKAFFEAILAVFNALSGLFNKKEETDAANTPANNGNNA